MVWEEPDPYAALGLPRACSNAQVRAAYRRLVKSCHPDRHPGDPAAAARIQALNAAYEVLGDPARRRAYDAAHPCAPEEADRRPAYRTPPPIRQDAHLPLQDFLRGAALDVSVRDPSLLHGVETYRLDVPAGTPPGARFRLKRTAPGASGVVLVRVKARPDYRFKVKGSDLRCDLTITARRAAEGGAESLRGLAGGTVRVAIPPRVARGTIVRISGEGMPRPRGGRGDLLVRILYRPDVRITNATPSR